MILASFRQCGWNTFLALFIQWCSNTINKSIVQNIQCHLYGNQTTLNVLEKSSPISEQMALVKIFISTFVLAPCHCRLAFGLL